MPDVSRSTSPTQGLTFCLAAITLAAPGADAAPVPYQIDQVGLTDGIHVGTSDGVSVVSSRPTAGNDAGYVVGHSRQWDGLTTAGQSAWIYDPADGSTTRLGLTGEGFEDAQGYSHSEVRGLGASGAVIGITLGEGGPQGTWYYAPGLGQRRLGFLGEGFGLTNPRAVNASGIAVGTTSIGESTPHTGTAAWAYDPLSDTTIRLGFTDAEHTVGPDDRQVSGVERLGDSDRVIGHSFRAAGGQSAWLQDVGDASPIRIGLSGGEFRSSSGEEHSSPLAANLAGDVIGHSRTFSGTSWLGQAGWIYGESTSISTRVGLMDAEHTRSDGEQFTTVQQLDESGRAIGHSLRYDEHLVRGQSAWLHAGSSGSRRIGLTDALHTSDAGEQRSSASFNSGHIAGGSTRYDGNAEIGNTAWVYDPQAQTYTTLGLFGSEFEGPNGQHQSSINFMNGAGLAAGWSRRVGSESPAAWHFDGTTTRRIGLTGDAYTRGDGHQYSTPERMNEAGQVVGLSYRYTDTTINGQTVWFYDPARRRRRGARPVLRLRRRRHRPRHPRVLLVDR